MITKEHRTLHKEDIAVLDEIANFWAAENRYRKKFGRVLQIL